MKQLVLAGVVALVLAAGGADWTAYCKAIDDTRTELGL
jgi:hypothetical protein